MNPPAAIFRRSSLLLVLLGGGFAFVLIFFAPIVRRCAGVLAALPEGRAVACAVLALLLGAGFGIACRKSRWGRALLCACSPLLCVLLVSLLLLFKQTGVLAGPNSDPDPSAGEDYLAAPMAAYQYSPETECDFEPGKAGGFNLETGAFIPYAGPGDPMEDTEWQAQNHVDVLAVPPANPAPARGVEQNPAVAFVGGSTIEIGGEDWRKTPYEFMRDFIKANPTTSHSAWWHLLPGEFLSDLLGNSSLPVPQKGKLSILPSGRYPDIIIAGPPVASSKAWLVRTLDGHIGLLQTVHLFDDKDHSLGVRWKFLEKVQPADPPAPPDLAELRCLAWLDEVRSNPGWLTWGPHSERLDRRTLQLPDWLPAPSQEEIAKIDTSAGVPRFVCFWFQCPGLDPLSVADVRLLGNGNRPLIDPADPASALNTVSARAQDSDTGWIIATLYVGRESRLPFSAAVQVRYSSGPWQTWRDLPPDFSGKMPIYPGNHITRTGQSPDGKAFVELTRTTADEIVVDPTEYERHIKIDEQIDFIAKTKDGRMLARSAIVASPAVPRRGSAEPETKIERYIFDVRLEQVVSFQGRIRPIWHVTVGASLSSGQY